MATWSKCFTVAAILAMEHPNGLTRQELFERAYEYDPIRFGDYIETLDMIIGKNDSQGSSTGMVSCVKEEDGQLFYDTSRKTYVPSLERYGFAAVFNDWLKNNGLNHLVLYERLTPINSEKCPLGFDWESIPGPGHCGWDYECEECDGDCRISAAKLKASSVIIEKREYRDCYKILDGD